MRTYDEAYAAAKEGRPFSNGTEGYAWTDNWCDTCMHDKGARDGSDESGCPLLLVALMGKTPVEWVEQPWQQIKGRPEGETAPVLGDTYHCTEFRDEDNGGDGGEPDPGPPPVIDGQVDMFEVFADQVVDQLPARPLAGAR